MPAPLLTSAIALAAQAKATPAFSALLAAASRLPSPPEVARHEARPNLAQRLGEPGMVQGWALGAVSAGFMLSPTAAAAAVAVPVIEKAIRQVKGHAVPAVAALYQKYISPKTVSPVAAPVSQEAVPAAASAPASVQKQEAQAVVMASAIVGVGFGNQVDRAVDKGAFDYAVYQQVQAAAAVVAPNTLFSEMSPVQRMAVATAATHAASGSYLRYLRQQEPTLFTDDRPAACQLVEQASRAQNATDVAERFLVDGKFSTDRFLDLVNLPTANGAPQVKDLLLNASFKKSMLSMEVVEQVFAPESVPSTPERQSSVNWLRKQVGALGQSLQDRRGRLEMAERPAQAPTQSV